MHKGSRSYKIEILYALLFLVFCRDIYIVLFICLTIWVRFCRRRCFLNRSEYLVYICGFYVFLCVLPVFSFMENLLRNGASNAAYLSRDEWTVANRIQSLYLFVFLRLLIVMNNLVAFILGKLGEWLIRQVSFLIFSGWLRGRRRLTC